jgi:hypothetical protein
MRGRLVDLWRLDVKNRQLRLSLPDKSAVVKHSIELGHWIKFKDSDVQAKTEYIDWLVKATEIWLHYNNINGEEGPKLIQARNPAINILKQRRQAETSQQRNQVKQQVPN